MMKHFDRFIEKLVREDTTIAAGAAVWSFCLVTYLLIGYFPVYSPRTLPFFLGEQHIPLMPWTVWIYVSEYPLMGFAYLALPHVDARRKYAKALLLLNTIAISVFVFFPTHFPREGYPIDASEGLNSWALTLIKGIDRPTNCFPSLHVAFCMLSSLALQPYHRARYLFFLVWTLFILVSTLTTKQHYLIDGILGIFLATAVWYWVNGLPALAPLRRFTEDR